MLDNNKGMLIFGLTKEEDQQLSDVIEKEKLPGFMVITSEMALMTIGDIIARLKFQLHDEALPEEKVILFNNFSDYELDKAIKVIRSSFKVTPMLAVVTPTSIDWSFKDLIEHLIEEREWFRSSKKRGTEVE